MPDAKTPPRPPKGTTPAGARLWRAVVGTYELDESERALLVEAVRTVDVLTRLHRLVADEGEIIDSPHGRKAHPALVEARQHRATLTRLIAALDLPDEPDEPATGWTLPTALRGGLG